MEVSVTNGHFAHEQSQLVLILTTNMFLSTKTELIIVIMCCRTLLQCSKPINSSKFVYFTLEMDCVRYPIISMNRYLENNEYFKVHKINFKYYFHYLVSSYYRIAFIYQAKLERFDFQWPT